MDTVATGVVMLVVFIFADQISCASSSSSLSNRIQFRNYFQMLSIADERAIGFYGVIRYFGWKKVNLIVQDENLFTVVSGTL